MNIIKPILTVGFIVASIVLVAAPKASAAPSEEPELQTGCTPQNWRCPKSQEGLSWNCCNGSICHHGTCGGV
jgi:hypothetical protein